MAPCTWRLPLAVFVLFAKGFRMKHKQVNSVLATSSRRQTADEANPTASNTLPIPRGTGAGQHVFGNPHPFAETAPSGPLGILPATLPNRYGDLFEKGASPQSEGDNQLTSLLTAGITSEMAEAEGSDDTIPQPLLTDHGTAWVVQDDMEKEQDEDASAEAAEKKAAAAAAAWQEWEKVAEAKRRAWQGVAEARVKGNWEARVVEVRQEVEDAKRKVQKLQHIKAEVKVAQDHLEGLANLRLDALTSQKKALTSKLNASPAASKKQLTKLKGPEGEEGSWSIDFPTFLSLKARHLKDHSTEEQLIESFKFFDVDGNGAITAAEAKVMMTDLRAKLSDKAAIMRVALAEGSAVTKATTNLALKAAVEAYSEKMALDQIDVREAVAEEAAPAAETTEMMAAAEAEWIDLRNKLSDKAATRRLALAEEAAVEKAPINLALKVAAEAYSEKMARDQFDPYEAAVEEAAPAAETTEFSAAAEADSERLELQIKRFEMRAELDQLEKEAAEVKKVIGRGCRGEACKRHAPKAPAPVAIGPPATETSAKEDAAADSEAAPGGGSSLRIEVHVQQAPLPVAPAAEPHALRLAPGVSVIFHSFQTERFKHLEGKTGVLIEMAEDGNWRVRLDGDERLPGGFQVVVSNPGNLKPVPTDSLKVSTNKGETVLKRQRWQKSKATELIPEVSYSEDAGYVSLSVSLVHLDPLRLSQSQDLAEAVSITIRDAIAQAGGGGVFPGELHFMAPEDDSPLLVLSWIQLPSMLLAQSFCDKIASSGTFKETLATSLQNIADIKSVTTGRIKVTEVKDIEAQATPPPAATDLLATLEHANPNAVLTIPSNSKAVPADPLDVSANNGETVLETPRWQKSKAMQLRNETQPSYRHDSGYVYLVLGLSHLDPHRLSRSADLIDAVSNTINEVIAREGDGTIFPGELHFMVPAEGSASSCWVLSWLELPSILLAQLFHDQMVSSQTFQKTLATSLQNIVGIKSITTGAIKVTEFKVGDAQAIPPPHAADVSAMFEEAKRRARQNWRSSHAFFLGLTAMAAQAFDPPPTPEEETADPANYHEVFNCPKEGASRRKPCNSFKSVLACAEERGCEPLFDGCRPIMDSEFPSYRDVQFEGRTYDEPCSMLPKAFGSGACQSDCRCMTSWASGDCVRIARQMKADEEGRFWPKMENCTSSRGSHRQQVDVDGVD